MRFHTPEHVEKVIAVTAHKSSGERDQPLCGAAEDSQGIALRRVAGQLVQFIGNGKIKPALHKAADVFDWCHALNAAPVRLPEGRKACSATTRASQNLRELALLHEIECRKLLHLRIKDGIA